MVTEFFLRCAQGYQGPGDTETGGWRHGKRWWTATQTGVDGDTKRGGWRHGKQMEDDPFAEYFEENVEGDENTTTV